uniref:hypothetical protein n=1 Tax=Acetatifactor sp. TaxID=1872090 RepID=UPI0040578433
MSHGTYQEIGNMSYGGGNSPERGSFPKGNLPEVKQQGVVNLKGIVLITGVIWVLIVIVSAFILIQSILQSRPKEQTDYTVEGQWTCRELGGIPDALEEVMLAEISNATPEEVALVLECCGLDKLEENTTFGFRDGSLELRFNGVSVESGMVENYISFSYKEEQDNKLLLMLTITIPAVDRVDISYLADYRVGEDWMIVDFFGYKLDLDRA